MSVIRKNLHIYIFLGICFISNGIFAQYNNLKFETFSTIEGLSSSTCVEIFQDSDGFLWFGTIDGLNRYDGYSFEIYRPVLNDNNSISNNWINSITEDSDGNLWIGTSNGLNVFQKQKFFRINLVIGRATNVEARDVINDLHYEKKSNSLWVAMTYGLSKINLEGAELSGYNNMLIEHFSNDINDDHTIDNNVINIAEGSKGQILIVTEGESLNIYNPDTNTFDRQLVEVSADYNLGHIPKLMLNDADGDFWIGNDLSKLVVWDKSSNKFRQVSYSNVPTPIFHLYQDSNDIIWIATDGFGICLVDKKRV